MDKPQIKILLLGPPIIMVGERLANVSRKHNRALLYYLASQRHPVSRGEICDIFWPDENETKARKNLRESLSRIRRELGQVDSIHSSDDQIMLDASLVYSDKREFDSIVLPLQNNPVMTSNMSLPGWMVLELQQAMDLCRTSQFLQGINLPDSPGFENWKDITNQWYSYSRGKIIDRLVDHYISSGHLESALSWLEAGLSSDRMNPEFNFLALTCLRDLGKFQQMIDYVNFLEDLYHETGETLPVEFLELRAKAETSRKSTDYANTQAWPDSEEGEVKFFSRQAELDQLNLALRKKGVLLLEGEAGSGKTRLVKEFYSRQDYAPRLFYIRAHPLAMRVPFQTILETLEREINKEEWDLLSLADQERLSTFYHEHLQGMKSSDLPVTDEGWLPLLQDVFNVFMKLLENAASMRPILFIVDNAQWIDLASLSILNYLIEQNYFKQYGLLILIKNLEDDNSPLFRVNMRLLKQKQMEIMRLPCFSESETSDFMHAMLGKSPSEDLVKKAYQNSGGNPFFLIECLKVANPSSIDASPCFGLANSPIPETIKGMFEGRLETITPEAMTVLQAAAVLGPHFAPDVLSMTAGFELSRALNMFEELTKSGILKVDQEVEPYGGYAFSHDIEREIILSKLSPGRRQFLHRQAAKSIIECRGRKPEISPILADHFEKASDAEQAVVNWLDAGRYYRLLFSKDKTIAAYEKAAELIRENPFLFPTELIHQVFTEWGNYAYDISDIQYCETIANTILEIGQLRTDALLIGAGLSSLGRAAGMLVETDKAQEYLQRAIFHLRRVGNIAELSETYSRIGIVYFIDNQFLKAKEAFEQGLREAEEKPGDPATMDASINNLSQLCVLLVYTGWPEKAHELALEMVNYSRGVIRRSALVQSNSTMALTHYSNGLFTEAIKIATETRELAIKLYLRYWQSLLDIILGESYLMIGDLDNAWLHIHQALEQEEKFPESKLKDQARLALANIYRRVGENLKAVEIYQQVIESGDQSLQVIESYYFLGVSLENMGKSREALKWIDRAIAVSSQNGLTAIELKAKITRAVLTSGKKSADEYELEIKPIINDLKSRGSYFDGHLLKLALATAAEKRGNMNHVKEAYIDLIMECQKLSIPFHEITYLQKILKLAPAGSLEREFAKDQSEIRVKEIMRKATTLPVKGYMQKMRAKLRKNWQ